MSYHIYQTEAFIIESQDLGEANKLITAFTKDLGLVRASAQGVRHLKSKLRYSLQELSFSTIALVRGKEMWRVTNARKLISLYDKRLPEAVRLMLAKVLGFVKRLVPEEGKHEELFTLLSQLSAFCFSERNAFYTEENEIDEKTNAKPKTVSVESVEALEYLTKLRILQILGYGSAKEEFKDVLNQDHQYVLDKVTIDRMKGLRATAEKEIQISLNESQL